MSERRALLDPDMYKISEEDSQDEEVLSGLSSKVTVSLTVSNEGNNNLPAKVKPIPPVKPAFLRKNPISNNNNGSTKDSAGGIGSSSGLLFAHKKDKTTTVTVVSSDRKKSPSGKGGSSLIFHRQNRSSSSTKKDGGLRDCGGAAGATEAVEWPSSGNSSSSSENSGEVSTEEESTSNHRMSSSTNVHSSRKGHSYKELKRKKKGKSSSCNESGGGPTWRQGGSYPNQSYQMGVSETETDDEESETSSGSQSCSSCDNHRRSRRSSNQSGHYLASDDNGSSCSYSSQYTSTDHPDDSDDLDCLDDEMASDHLEDELALTLLTESEIKLWTHQDGSVLYCEPFTEKDTFEAERAHDISSPPLESTAPDLHTKSVRTKPSTNSPQEKASISRSLNATGRDAGDSEVGSSRKTQKTYSGKISRLLKRGKSSKQHHNLPQEEVSSSNGKETGKGKSEGIRCKGNGTGGPEKVFRFKDEHDGEIRQVELTVTSCSKHNLGRRATMVESLLGIVPSTFSSTNNSTHSARSANQGCQQQQTNATSATDRLSLHNNRSTRPETEDRRIMVAGFIPDGPAARNRLIKIGDWLQRVNGVFVDFNNVNSVLLEAMPPETTNFDASPFKILLELQRVSGYTVTEPLNRPSSSVFGDIKPSSNGKDPRQHETFILPQKKSDQEIPSEIMSNIAVLFVSSVNTNPPSAVGASKEKTKDVIFAWPKESESRKVKAMAGSHGMFSTLYKLLRDVTGSNPISSRVMIDDEEMDVVFSSDDDGKGLLLLAMSTTLSNFNVSQPHLSALNLNGPKENLKKEKKIRWKDPVNGGLVLAQRIMDRLESLLKYQFGSLSRAFRSTPEDKLQGFLAQVLVTLNDISEDFLFPQVAGNFLRVPSRIRSILDERLYSFETSDSFTLCYGDGESEPPLLTCLGSCLLYKGMVVTSHLEKNLASQFDGWWKTQLRLWGGRRNTLPCFWDPVRRLIVWQETFQHLEDSGGQLPCYSVLLGLEHYMLGFVLEPVNPSQRLDAPHVGWIRRGLNCILRMCNSEVHSGLEKWILSQENEFIELFPPRGAFSRNISSTEAYSPSVKKIPKITPSPGPTGSILKNSDSSAPLPPLDGVVGNAVGNNSLVASPSSSSSSGLYSPHLVPPGLNTPSSESSSNTSSSTATTDGYGGGSQATLQDYSYHHGLSVPPVPDRLGSNISDDENDVDENTTGTGSDTSSFKWNADELESSVERVMEEGIKSISVTKGNVLFDFLQIEHGRGVILMSQDNLQGPFAVVVHNFRQSATVSHHILQKAANGRKRFSQQDGDKKWVSKALAPISEHGILFNCDVVDPRDAHKKKPRLRQVSYWVIGRIYPNQREVYVCFQDSSVAQNLLEIAFKLAYFSI